MGARSGGIVLIFFGIFSAGVIGSGAGISQAATSRGGGATAFSGNVASFADSLR